jgi:hypothetical protein
LTAAAQSKCDELVPKLMEISGINGSFANMSASAQSLTEALFDREGSMPAKAKHAFEDVVAKGLNGERMGNNVESRLKSSCDAALYNTALEQMQSPLGQKMLQMEIAIAATPEAAKRMQRFVGSFSMQSPRESRMALIRDLMVATKVVDFFADNNLAVSTEMLKAVKAAPTQEQVAELRGELVPKVQEFTEAEMYYAYRSASDEDLKQYAEMQSSKAGQRFNQDVAKAFLYATKIEAADLGTKLAKVVAEQRAQRDAQ